MLVRLLRYHFEEERTLTVREAARLQGFDDQFEFSGSLDTQMQLVGNAVPLPLAEALGATMDLPSEPYKGPDRKNTALLMMAWASDIIGPHKTFVQHSARRGKPRSATWTGRRGPD